MKQRAWEAFSKYIRLRDSNEDGYCACISCGKVKFWEKDGMQAGHLIAGRSNNILFDEELVHAQCAQCNNNSGEQARYWMALKKKEGYEDHELFELEKRKNILKKYHIQDFVEIEDYYLDQVNGLLIKKGLI